MDPGAIDNYASTVKDFFEQLAAVEQRVNIGAEQKIQIKLQIFVRLFKYVSSHPKFLAIKPPFRRAVKAKAQDFIVDPNASNELIEAAGDLINIINNLPADPDYVAGGDRRLRRRPLQRKSRKDRKSRRRRST